MCHSKVEFECRVVDVPAWLHAGIEEAQVISHELYLAQRVVSPARSRAPEAAPDAAGSRRGASLET